MTKTIIIPDGIITLAESKAVCPHCTRPIPFEEIEDKFQHQSKHYIRIKCECKRFIGITQDIKGDYRAYDSSK